MTDRMFFRGIVLFGHHGVFAEEEFLGQRFEIDLDCFFDSRPAGNSDDPDRTMDYSRIYTGVKSVVEGQRFQLIEALAEAIAERLLQEFAILLSVRVEVRKPAAPVPGVFQTVGIEITRDREIPSAA